MRGQYEQSIIIQMSMVLLFLHNVNNMPTYSKKRHQNTRQLALSITNRVTIDRSMTRFLKISGPMFAIICPNGSQVSFSYKGWFFNIDKNLQIFDYFCTKICCLIFGYFGKKSSNQDISKIAQPGHTGRESFTGQLP